MVSLEVLTRVRLMPPRSTASPLAKCGEGAVDVAEIDGEPLDEVLAPPWSMVSPLPKYW